MNRIYQVIIIGAQNLGDESEEVTYPTIAYCGETQPYM